MKTRPDIDIAINENNGIPIWLQLRNRLVYLISSGHFKVGEQLPTVRELAVELGINYNTISRVYQDIERDGYIMTKRGRGTFVLENPKDNGEGQDYKGFFKEFIRQCEEIGIPRKDIVGLMQSIIDS